MARPRQFDVERAVDAALEAFLAAGYEATSTQDLCQATGLARSSIYSAFNSKRDLYERALARFMERKNAETFALLESELPVHRKIRTLFQRIIDEEYPPREEGRGCLVVKSAIEVAARDREIAGTLARDYGERLSALRAAIDAGKRDGDIAADKDSRALAHLVIATISGLRVSARCGAGRAALESVADTALAAF
ncbi:TetR/AcrR family transcriptional regulator [Streptomyces sp. NPDC003077]|uniref:TetR/AcrR family transcriptional regulator n=1 Tax=Streptomyces sp. NPDC003077 TaxID=3154443 RepID=UPI0033AB7BAD